MDFDEILPELLVGSHPGKPLDIAWLHERHAVRAVLSLQSDADHARLGIDWPVTPDEAIVSDKDRQLPLLSEAADLF